MSSSSHSSRRIGSVASSAQPSISSNVIISTRRSPAERPKSLWRYLCVLLTICSIFVGFYWFLTHKLHEQIHLSVPKDSKILLRKEIEQPQQGVHQQLPTAKRKRYAYAITITKDGFFQDGAAVLAYSIMKYSWNASYDISFVAFVHPNVTTSRPGLEKLGFHVIEVPIPINRTAIQFEFLREKIEKNGCCGSSELIKLTSYRLLQYERVIHLDADVIFLNPIDDLFQKDYSLIYTTDPNMATFKGLDKMPVQGGFIILQPNEDDYRRIIHTEMTTEFKKHHGWNSSHIGWFWGGMTVQGILPYYYNRVTRPGRSLIVDRCYYNSMADTKECQTQTLSDLKSAHFTVCQKPWGCFKRLDIRLCNDLHGRWFQLRSEAEKFYGIPSLSTCQRGGHKNYVPMNLERAKLPEKGSAYYYLRQNVITDDSPSRFNPLPESKYLTDKYN